MSYETKMRLQMNATRIALRGIVALAIAALLVAPALAPPAVAQKSKAPAGRSKASVKHRRGHNQAARSRATSRSAQPKGSGLHVVPAAGPGGASAAPGVRMQGAPPIGPQGTPPAAPGGGPIAAPDTRGTPPSGPGGPPPGGPPPSGPPPGGFSGFGGGGGGGLVSMDFRGADINNVLKFFAMATNWEIVPDAGLTGPVTIISPKQLTTDQAFQVLQAVLEIRGFSGQLETRGNTQVLRIVPLDRAVTSTRNLAGPALGPDGQPLPPDKQPRLSPDELKNQVVTEVFPIENVDAGSLSRELTPLINKGASIVGSSGSNALIVTDTASNVHRIGSLIDMLDKAASNNDIERVALHHADATDVASAINSLFSKVFSRGRGGSGPAPGQPGQPPMPVPQPGQPGQAGAAGADARAAVVAVADTRTNSVIVVASADNMKRVKALIQDLDDPGAQALDTYWRKLKYADAGDVADTINGILSGTSGTGGRQQGATFGQRVFGGGGFGPFGGGFGGFGGQQQQTGTVQSTDPFAKVVANVRTNTLVIMATKERMEKIDDLIKELDVEVAVEPTTFVIPLRNAQAQDMAYTLSQAFGTGGSGSNNPFGGIFGFFGGGSNQRQQRQPIQRRQGQSSTNNPFGRAAAATRAVEPTIPVQSSADGIHGVLTQGGFVPDQNAPQAEEEMTRQFGFPFGGGFGSRTQMQTPQYGRGSSGRYVNLLQLRQNVGVTADIGSNSLIITTTPDNMKAIQEIIDSLDVVPRQVMIEVIIAEATLDSTQKLGFQFDTKGVGRIFGNDISQSGSSNFPLGNAGSTAANIAGSLIPGAQYGVQAVSGRFSALVQALSTDNRVKILSTPKVFTSNNQEAQINITTNLPYQSNSFTGTFGSSAQVSYLQVGVQLDVTPRITKDGLVTIDVVATDSELLGFDTITSTPDANGHVTQTLAPRYSDRTTDTSVSVRDGEIIALGGLMRDSKTINVNKVPLLSQIPILGALFRSTSSETIKSELMLFMIPHVVDGELQNRAMVKDQANTINKAIPELKSLAPELDPKNVGRPIYDGSGVKNPPRSPQVPQTPPKDDKKQ